MYFQTRETFDLSGEDFARLIDASGVDGAKCAAGLTAFYQSIAHSRRVYPRIVTVHQADELIGVVAMMVRQKSSLYILEAVDLGDSDFAMPVMSSGVIEAIAGDAVLQGSLLDALLPFDLVRVGPVSEPAAQVWHVLLGGQVNRLSSNPSVESEDETSAVARGSRGGSDGGDNQCVLLGAASFRGKLAIWLNRKKLLNIANRANQ